MNQASVRPIGRRKRNVKRECSLCASPPPALSAHARPHEHATNGPMAPLPASRIIAESDLYDILKSKEKIVGGRVTFSVDGSSPEIEEEMKRPGSLGLWRARDEPPADFARSQLGASASESGLVTPRAVAKQIVREADNEADELKSHYEAIRKELFKDEERERYWEEATYPDYRTPPGTASTQPTQPRRERHESTLKSSRYGRTPGGGRTWLAGLRDYDEDFDQLAAEAEKRSSRGNAAWGSTGGASTEARARATPNRPRLPRQRLRPAPLPAPANRRAASAAATAAAASVSGRVASEAVRPRSPPHPAG